jgi:hypothetical protein
MITNLEATSALMVGKTELEKYKVSIKADNSPPTSAEITNVGVTPQLPQYAFMSCTRKTTFLINCSQI